jgi:hypothetical protein
MPPLPSGGIRYFRKWLFDSQTVEADLALGIIRDVSRRDIPDGGTFELVDFMVDLPGRIYKRGGTTYHSDELTPLSPISGESMVVAVMTPDFESDPRVLAIVSNGGSGRSLFDVTDVVPHLVGEIQVQPHENPSYFVDETGAYVVVCDSQNGTRVPEEIYLNSGGVVVSQPMDDTITPTARVSAAHIPYFVLANTPDHPNRIWFSGIGSLNTGWLMTGTDAHWLDIDDEIVAMKAFSGVLLVWTRHKLYRILGDTAPGSPVSSGGTVMYPQPVADVGCIDARSVVAASDGCYFANENGIYITDGAKVTSLTETTHPGISRMWRDEVMAGYFPELGHVTAMGIYQDMYLFVSVLRDAPLGELPDTVNLLCFLPNNSWVQPSIGMSATMFATSLAGKANLAGTYPLETSNDIFMAQPFRGDTARVVKAKSIFTPTSENNYDAGGSGVIPMWSTRAYTGGSLGMKRFGYGHLTYRMWASGSANPTLQILQAHGIEQVDNFEESKEGSPMPHMGELPSPQMRRRRFRMFTDSQGLIIKVQQTDVSDQTEIFALEMEIGMFQQAEVG